MKNFWLASLMLLLLVMTVMSGCTTSSTPGPVTMLDHVAAFFSWPYVIILKNATAQPNNYWIPISGEAVTNAVVTVANSTTGVSTTCAYNATSQAYIALSALNHVTGESVTLNITHDGQTITGGPTTTPDTSASISSPASNATVSRPFDISWTVNSGASAATHVWITLHNSMEGYQVFLPITTTTYQITSAMIPTAGNYVLNVYPVNMMTLTGAASGSFCVVGSVNWNFSRQVTVN